MNKYYVQCPLCDKEYDLEMFEGLECCGHEVSWDENEDCDVFPVWEKKYPGGVLTLSSPGEYEKLYGRKMSSVFFRQPIVEPIKDEIK